MRPGGRFRFSPRAERIFWAAGVARPERRERACASGAGGAERCTDTQRERSSLAPRSASALATQYRSRVRRSHLDTLFVHAAQRRSHVRRSHLDTLFVHAAHDAQLRSTKLCKVRLDALVSNG
jgi:hypothetical protein